MSVATCAAALVLAGCGSAPAGADSGSAGAGSGSTAGSRMTVQSAERTLVGTMWRLDGLPTKETRHGLPEGLRSTLRLDEHGHLALGFGCNRAAGQMRVEGDRLAVGRVDLVPPVYPCASGPAQVGRTVLDVLQSPGLTYGVHGDRLRIVAGSDVLSYIAG